MANGEPRGERSEDGVRPGLGKRVLEALRTPRGWVALVATALIGWSLTYFGPKLFESTPASFSVEVQPNPDLQIQAPATVYAVPLAIDEIGPPPAASRSGAVSPAAESCSDRYAWAHAMGAADLSESNAQVTIANSTASVVTVTGTVNVRRKPPIVGSVLSCLGLGGALDPKTICVDLALSRLASCTQGPHRKRPFARQLASGEVEVLELKASGSEPIAAAQVPNGVYEWTVELDVSVDGAHHRYLVDDNGEPFRTYVTDRFASLELDTYDWIEGGWRSREESLP